MALEPEPDVGTLVFILFEVESLAIVKIEEALGLTIETLLLIKVNFNLDGIGDASHKSHATIMLQERKH